jgi:hypothetical protein
MSKKNLYAIDPGEFLAEMLSEPAPCFAGREDRRGRA